MNPNPSRKVLLYLSGACFLLALAALVGLLCSQ